MSWARDEWKNELTSAALQNVDKLEKSLEALKKDKQQRIFQIESLEAALALQRRKNDEEKSKCIDLQRELQSITERYADASKAREKLTQDIQLKDSRLNVVEGQLQSAKQLIESEKSKYGKLITELEKEQADKLNLELKLEKVTEERGKLIEMNNIQRQKLSSGGSSSEDLGSSKLIADLEKKLKEANEELNSMKETKSEVMQPKSLKSNNDLMSFDTSPKMQIDLMCFDEPACVSKESDVNLLDIDSSIHTVTTEQLPVVENRMSDLNRLLNQARQDLTQCDADLKAKDRELIQLNAKLEKESGNSENLQKKVQLLSKELDCQRHNFEAAREHQEERNKEKERHLREEMASQREFVTNLEKEFRELQQKSQHESHCAKNKEAELMSQLSRLQHEFESLNHAHADVAAERKEVNAALMSSEKRVTELARETKALNHQKDSMVNELESAYAKAKKFEAEIGILKGDFTSKDNIIKQLDSELQSCTAQVEKLKNSSQKDVNNLKAEVDRARKDSLRLESEKSTVVENLQRADLVIKELECKVKDLEGNLLALKKDASIKDRELDVKKREEESLKSMLEQTKENALSKDEEVNILYKAQEEMKKQVIDAERSCQSAAQELEELKKSHKELLERLAASDDELQCKRQEIEKVKTEFQEEAEKLEGTISAGWIQKFDDYERRRAAVEAECDELKISAEAMKNVINNAETERHEMLFTIEKKESERLKVVEESMNLKKRIFELENSEEDKSIMLQELRNECDRISENMKELSIEKDHYKNLNVDMNKKLSELVSSKDTALFELESIKTECESATKAKEGMAVTNDELVKERALHLEKITRLEEACTQIKIDTEKAVHELAEQRATKTALTNECIALKEDVKSFKDLKVELESVVSERENQVQVLVQEKQKVKEVYDSVVLERDSLKNDVDELLLKLSDIQEMKESTELRFAQYVQEKQEHLDRLAELRTETLFLQEERCSLKESIAALKASLVEKEKQQKQNEDEKNATSVKLQELSRDLECCQNEKGYVERELLDRGVQYVAIKQENDDLQVKLDSALLQVSQLNENFSSNNVKVQTLEAEVRGKEESIEKLNAQLEVVQMDLEDQRDCFEQRVKEMSEIETEKNALDVRLISTIEMLKSCEVKIAELEELCFEKQETISDLKEKIDQSKDLQTRLQRTAADAEVIEQQKSLAESMLQLKVELLTEKEKEIASLKKNLDFYDQSLMHKTEELEKMNRKWEEVESQVRDLSEEKEALLVERNCSVNQLAKERDSLAESWQEIVKERDHFKNIKEDLERQFSELILSKDTAMAELEFANRKYDDLLNENNKVKIENSEFLREKEGSLQKIKHLEEKLEELRSNVDKSVRDSAAHQLNVETLNLDILSLKDECGGAKRRIKELEYLIEVMVQEKAEATESIQKITSERDAIRIEFDEMHAKMASNIQILKEENESRLDCVIQESQGTREALANAQAEAKALNEEKAELVGVIDKLELASREKDSHVQQLGEEKSAMEMKLKEVEGEIEQLRGYVDLKDKVVRDLEEYSNGKEQEVEALSSAKEGLLLKIESLSVEIEDVVQSKVALSAKIVDYETTVLNANAEITDLKQAIERAKVQVTSLEKEKEDLSTKELSLMEENEKLKKSLRNIHEEMSLIRNELLTMKENLSSLEEGSTIKEELINKLMSEVEFQKKEIQNQGDLMAQKDQETRSLIIEKESLNEKAAALSQSLDLKSDELLNLTNQKEELVATLGCKDSDLERLRFKLEEKESEMEVHIEQRYLADCLLKVKIELLDGKEKEMAGMKRNLIEYDEILMQRNNDVEDLKAKCKELEMKLHDVITEKEMMAIDKTDLILEREKMMGDKEIVIRELKDDVQKYCGQLEIFTEKQQLQERELLTSSEKLSELSNINDNLTEETKLLKNELKCAQEEVSLKTELLSKQEEEISLQSGVIKECQNLAKSFKNEIEHLQSEITRINAGVEVKDKYISDLCLKNAEMESNLMEKESTIQRLNDDKETLERGNEERISKLQSDIGAMQDEMNELKEGLGRKEEKCKLLREEIELKAKEILNICDENEVKERLLAEKEDNITCLKSEISELSKKCREFEDLLSCNADDIKLLKVEVDDLIRQCDEKDESCQAIKAEKDLLDEEVGSLNHKVETLEEEKIKLQEELEDARNVAQESGEQCDALTEEVKALKVSLSDRDAVICMKDEEIDSHQESLKCKEDKICLKEEEIKSIRQLLRGLETQLVEKNEHIDTISQLSRDRQSEVLRKEQEIISTRKELEKQVFGKDEEVRSLQVLVDNLESKMSKREAEVIICKKSLEDREKEIFERNQTIEANLQLLGTLQQEIASKNSEIGIIKDDISEKEVHCAMLEKQLLEYKKDLSSYLRTIEDLKSKVNEKEALLVESNEKVELVVKKHADEVEKSKCEYKKLINVLVEKDCDIDSLRSEGRKTQSNLTKKINELEKVLASKADELSQKVAKIENLELKLGSHKYDHDALFTTMTDDVKLLTDKVDSLEVRNGKLDKEMWERNAEIEGLTQEKIALAGENKLLIGRMQELEEEKNILKEENIASLKAKEDKIKKYVSYVTELQSKMEKYRRHSREAKRSSAEQRPNEQSAVRQRIKDLKLETPTTDAVTPEVKGETPLKRAKLSQDGPSEGAKKSRLLTLKASSLPRGSSPIASRTRRKIAKKDSPPRVKPYPKSKPESISDVSESESENQAKDIEVIKDAKSDRLRNEPPKCIGLSPAKTNQLQPHPSKFRPNRLGSSAKYDFEKDFAKEMTKEEKKRPVKLKSLRDLKNDKEQTEDHPECQVQ